MKATAWYRLYEHKAKKDGVLTISYSWGYNHWTEGFDGSAKPWDAFNRKWSEATWAGVPAHLVARSLGTPELVLDEPIPQPPPSIMRTV